MDELCNEVDWFSGLMCIEEVNDHGPMHKAWAHYPGQLYVWPVDSRSDQGL
jgi:hypothetical protein